MSVVEITEFVDSLFGEEKGYAYAPTKDVDNNDYWQPYFFKWPEQREALLTHMLSSTKTRDCYLAPSLFKTHSAKPNAWKGSRYVWTEFDGNAPSKVPDGIPEPTIRIQSSTNGHEHWYWRLEEFQTNKDVHMGITQGLAYKLDADRSAWDAGQVLRPPGTRHHESGRKTHLLKHDSSTEYKLADFSKIALDEPETHLDRLQDAPSAEKVIAKYAWQEDVWDLLQKETIEVGSRSSAMVRLGHHCVEMGMSNEECYAILLFADDKWGKYKSRSDAERANRLIGIVRHCRSKQEVRAELSLSDRESFVSVGDFLQTEYKVKWLFRDFLAYQGLGIISSQPGVGKTTFSLGLGFSTVLGADYLQWKSESDRGTKVAFLSLEMAGDELNAFITNILSSYPAEDLEVIKNNFFVLPLGYALMLHDPKNQQLVLDEIDRLGIEVLIIDSLKAATGLKEGKTDDFFNWINQKVRAERKCTVWMIHHNKKQGYGEGEREPSLEDLYGDTFITAHPSTVVSLRPKGINYVEVHPVKIRMAKKTKGFVVKRTDKQTFEITDQEVKDYSAQPAAAKPDSQLRPGNDGKSLFG